MLTNEDKKKIREESLRTLPLFHIVNMIGLNKLSKFVTLEEATGYASPLQVVEGWKDVNEELPDEDVYVLWRFESGMIIYEDIPHDSDWPTFKEMCERESTGPITHWMPVPEVE